MKALVTGATGFIGSNVVRALLAQGYQVRALLRECSNRANLAGLDVEPAPGDVRDRASVERALTGCDVLFHMAAAYALWVPEPQMVYDTNVEGTVNVLNAARAAGVARAVYTSTESTIGIAQNGDLGTEAMFVEPSDLAGHYKRSKFLAEQLALRMAGEGLEVVVVNPTTPIGPGDVRPTPTGQIVVDFLNGKMPAYVNTGLNLVDVEDVAQGHILALEKGRPGERYILGNRNLTLKEILGALSRVTGLPAPRLRIPIWLALWAAYASEFAARRLGGPPRIPVTGVKVARHFRYFDCSKAVRELGLPQTPIEQALGKAVRWFRAHGYAT
ncbi:MAG TPA: NAD-dependent epimerase/dehydratase family protein [Anaerolineae bacterium]|nr:NAD-dependent epimerase/dehydratase family protein [Anaerolineae bacterium]HOQ97628.1 NAD-dependent epimerase/dehydratase family protein [Anaerolineae bacterium]HPL27826.1 NAD-dependent epimerase/dehydratase family protein [Anaerolineae bacterium]